MAKDFEQIGHKNLELLRYYVSNDIKRIDQKLEKADSAILGFIVASLVDILIVVFFDDLIKEYIKGLTCNKTYQALYLLLCILILLLLFIAVSFVVSRIVCWREIKEIISGERKYKRPEEQLKIIDDFDNIACDGLLICQNYIQRYSETSEDYIREFYLYEIIHHLEKARIIFSAIFSDKDLLIATKKNNYHPDLIDTYRVNNFIVFSQCILAFLEVEIKHVEENKDLLNDMQNLRSDISSWEKIQ